MAARLKILFITRKWPPAVGGMESWSADLAREIRSAHRLTLHALPGRDDGAAPGAWALVRFGLRTAVRLVREPSEHDVVQGGDMAVWPLVWLAGLRQRGARIALASHGTDVSYVERESWRARLYAAYVRLGARLLPRARVLANSRSTARLTRSLGFRDVTVVPLATKVEGPLPEQEPERHLLFAGRVLKQKGLSWFVSEVLPRLPEDLRLRVAGTVWDQEERRALADPRVEFLGPLPPSELHAAMQRALAVVMPNIPAGAGRREGFGLVAIEAAAAGGVTLAASLDGLADAVREGETGFLLPPRDPGAWADAVARVAGWSLAERQRFISGAQTAVSQHHGWEQVMRQILAVWGYPESGR